MMPWRSLSLQANRHRQTSAGILCLKNSWGETPVLMQLEGALTLPPGPEAASSR